MIDIDEEDYDVPKIVVAIILLVFVVIGFWMAWSLHQARVLQPFIEQCTSNPALRYQNGCTTVQDCTLQCAYRLRDSAKTQEQKKNST